MSSQTFEISNLEISRFSNAYILAPADLRQIGTM